MRITDAIWTKEGNVLEILCSCGNILRCRSDRWKLRCTECGEVGHLSKLREGYVRKVTEYTGTINDNSGEVIPEG